MIALHLLEFTQCTITAVKSIALWKILSIFDSSLLTCMAAITCNWPIFGKWLESPLGCLSIGWECWKFNSIFRIREQILCFSQQIRILLAIRSLVFGMLLQKIELIFEFIWGLFSTSQVDLKVLILVFIRHLVGWCSVDLHKLVELSLNFSIQLLLFLWIRRNLVWPVWNEFLRLFLRGSYHFQKNKL